MGPIKVSTYPIFMDHKASGSDHVRAAVLADYHNNPSEEEREELVRLIADARPDLILSAGDMITAKAGRCGYVNAMKLLEQLTETAPVYCVNGNHESRLRDEERYGGGWNIYRQKLERLGVRVLTNESARVTVRGMSVQIYGLELPLPVYRRFRRTIITAGDIEQRLGKAQPGMFHILLAHHPDYVKAYERWGANLVLSGHLHGGLIRLPLLGGVAGASYLPFPKYDHGRYPFEGGEMIVSAGLGDHTLPIRFNNPHELVLADIGAGALCMTGCGE